MKITIKPAKLHGPGHYCAYRGETMIATLSRGKPTRTNGRAGLWGVMWLTGRVDWHDTRADAWDNVRKG